MQKLIFTDVLVRRTQHETSGAIRKVLVRLRQLGFPVFRLHSDRGGEFVNRSVRKLTMDHDLLHTATESDNPGSNGHAEQAVGAVKRGIRARLHEDPGYLEAFWSLAARDVGAVLNRQVLSRFDSSLRPLLPWGCRVHVREKSFSESHWSSRMIPGCIVGPSELTPRGYVIALEPLSDGKFLVSTTVRHRGELSTIPTTLPGEIWNLDLPSRRHCTKRGVDDALDGAERLELDDLAVVGGEVHRLESPVDARSGAFQAADQVGEADGLDLRIRRTTVRPRQGLSCDTSESLAWSMLQQSGLDRDQCAALLYASLAHRRSKRNRLIDQELMTESDAWVCSLGAYSHGPMQGIISESRYRPMLIRLANRLVVATDAGHTYTAIRVSFQAASGWHRDLHNEKTSMNLVMKLSRFEGGRIVLNGGVVVEYDERGSLRFDLKENHSVEPSVGPRLVLIAYTPANAARLSVLDVNLLLSLGFNVPVNLRPAPHAQQPVMKAFAAQAVNAATLSPSALVAGSGCTCRLPGVESMSRLSVPLAAAVPGEFVTSESNRYRYFICCMSSVENQLILEGPNETLGGVLWLSGRIGFVSMTLRLGVPWVRFQVLTPVANRLQ